MGKIFRIVTTVILLVGYTAHSQVWLVSRTIPSHGLHVQYGSGDSSVLSVDTTVVTMAQYHGGAVKSIVIDTAGMVIRDDDKGIGPVGAGDYSSVATNLTFTQKIYQDRNLGGQPVSATIYSPSDEEHGDLIMWDTNCDCYVSLNVVPWNESAGLMIVVIDTVLFSNTTIDTIVTLPVAAVIHDIYVYVATTFDGSGTDLLDIGISGSGNRYEDNLDVAVGAGFPGMSLTNIRDRMAGTTNIIFQYFDSNADANNGEAYVYVHYSIH